MKSLACLLSLLKSCGGVPMALTFPIGTMGTCGVFGAAGPPLPSLPPDGGLLPPPPPRACQKAMASVSLTRWTLV